MEDFEVVDNELVDKYDAEDTIFNNCMNDFSEFPKFITGYDDIEGRYSSKHMDLAFKNLNVDSAFQRKNNRILNIEHHSSLKSRIMRRNFNYTTTLAEASGQMIDPWIFNTGPIPGNTVEYINETTFFNPKFKNTRNIDGTANLNNLRYKVNNKIELTQTDALNLIWLLKTNINIDEEKLLHELVVKIWENAVALKWMLDAIRKNLMLWGKKYLKNEKLIKEFKVALKMSKIEIKPFEEQLRIAGIAGELERAEKRGIKQGKQEGREEGWEEGREEGRMKTEEKFIIKLLKHYKPDEISKEFDIPLKRILEIQ